jgi:16S rRNA (uracil1498-N3)-methyltransferase
MFLFYAPDVRNDARSCFLNEEESFHCIRVLRLKKDEAIRLTNGKGTLFEGYLGKEDPRKQEVIVTASHTDFEKRPFHLHVAAAPTKNINRFEWFLEKAVEIGIDRITPLLCEHGERNSINRERMNKVMIAALKQSGHTWLPAIDPMIRTIDLARQDFEGQRFIAHYGADNPQLAVSYNKGSNARILIGPEGDFSPKEIEPTLQSGFIPVNLGNFRLRTETAALYACMAINLINLR